VSAAEALCKIPQKIEHLEENSDTYKIFKNGSKFALNHKSAAEALRKFFQNLKDLEKFGL
jgi:hypothetical protein